MNNYYFKKEKVIELLEEIRKGLLSDKKILDKGFELDLKEWEYKVDFDIYLKILDKYKNKDYLPYFSKEKMVDGFGKILLITDNNPYLIFDFIIASLFTNNKVTVALENKYASTNSLIIESIKKVIRNNKYDDDTVDYISINNKYDIVERQDLFDLVYYYGNKEEYISFTKRLHIDSKFDSFGEIYVYVDSKDFLGFTEEIDKYAYDNDIKINYYKGNLLDVKDSINKNNNINNISIIFTKNIDIAYDFIKEIKSENVYVNINPFENDIYMNEVKVDKLVYEKNIIISK